MNKSARVVAFLSGFIRGRASVARIAEGTGLKPSTARDALIDLVRKRRVREIDRGPRNRKIYQLLYCRVEEKNRGIRD